MANIRRLSPFKEILQKQDAVARKSNDNEGRHEDSESGWRDSVDKYGDSYRHSEPLWRED